MKRIISIAIITLVIGCSNQLFATGKIPAKPLAKGSITGKVEDTKTGESLVGVAVSIEGSDLKVYTDLDGTFTINSIAPGSYNLILSLISYKNSLVENVKINPSAKEIIDVKLDIIH